MSELKYISTRGAAPELGFEDTLLAGLASDGGLYVPKHWPQFERVQFKQLKGHRYEDVVLEVLLPFVGDTFKREHLSELIEESYASFRHPERCPLVELAPQLFMLELFHGPTLAFKDFALQVVARMFAEVLQRRNRRVTIVAATSGDTGSAAIEAFRGLPSADVFILYPHEKVSEIQRRQMTTPTDSNVHAIAVEGNFDDCQARVKDMFNDEAFRNRFSLGAVNSINWARIAVQAAYFVFSALKIGAPDVSVSFTVPTGNFGNIFSGYVAKKLGLPIRELVIATNQNDILKEFFSGGEYRLGKVEPSLSPSMDIAVSSNFERALFEAYGRDSKKIAKLMKELDGGSLTVSEETLDELKGIYGCGRIGESATIEEIRYVWLVNGRQICPHTAVGISLAKEFVVASVPPMISLATAHPAKFGDVVEYATRERVKLPEEMKDIFSREERITLVPNDLSAIQSIISERANP